MYYNKKLGKINYEIELFCNLGMQYNRSVQDFDYLTCIIIQ